MSRPWKRLNATLLIWCSWMSCCPEWMGFRSVSGCGNSSRSSDHHAHGSRAWPGQDQRAGPGRGRLPGQAISRGRTASTGAGGPRRAQFTPNGFAQSLSAVTTIGELSIDYARYRVTKGGCEVALTPTEYRILAYLAENAGRVITQDLLLEHVWGPEYVGEGHMLRVNITRLRHKLETDPSHPRYLLTRPGYRLPARRRPRCAGGTLAGNHPGSIETILPH